MAATSGKQLAVGLRSVTAYALTTTGYLSPGATPHTPYEGVTVSGPKAFTLNVPEPRKITHVGEDRPLAVDFLPPTEAMDGELRCSPSQTEVIALLSSLVAATVGEAKLVALATSQQGFEPQVGLLLYQQSLDVTLGTRRWRSFILPSARCIYMPSGMSDNTEDTRYMIVPAVTSQHIWGTALSASVEGCTSMQGIEMMTDGRPNIVAWLADGTEDDFLLPTTKPATAVGKMKVWIDGVPSVPDTLAVDTLTYTVAPTVGQIITCLYEW